MPVARDRGRRADRGPAGESGAAGGVRITSGRASGPCRGLDSRWLGCRALEHCLAPCAIPAVPPRRAARLTPRPPNPPPLRPRRAAGVPLVLQRRRGAVARPQDQGHGAAGGICGGGGGGRRWERGGGRGQSRAARPRDRAVLLLGAACGAPPPPRPRPAPHPPAALFPSIPPPSATTSARRCAACLLSCALRTRWAAPLERTRPPKLTCVKPPARLRPSARPPLPAGPDHATPLAKRAQAAPGASYIAVLKGAPEMVRGFLAQVPGDYDATYKRFAAQVSL